MLRTIRLIVIFSALPQGVWKWKDIIYMLLHKPGSALSFLQDGKLVDGCWVGLVELSSWCALTFSRIQSSPFSYACEDNESSLYGFFYTD